ncbi:MAG: ATP-binding protein [Proteobacteria bacterium]|nr:ATP-binding protein [Pseudomonadota bacterium]
MPRHAARPHAARPSWMPTTNWLVRVRWVVSAGYVCAAMISLGIHANASVISATLLGAASTALTNPLLRRASDSSDRLVAGLLILDVALLAVVMALTGGASNPFAILLIVHIALASLVSRTAWSWTVVLAAVVAYGCLFFVGADSHLWHRTLDLWQEPVQLHLVGMWVATAMTAIAITGLTRQILRAVERHRSYARESERRLERTTHLASLTTLAAGAAHELGSPLTTVAVLARELEHQAKQGDVSELSEDAATIRAEVDRCREILDRMSAGVGIHLSSDTVPPCPKSLPESVNERLDKRAARVAWEGQLPTLTAAAMAQLTQLVLPLVGNALDACEGDTIQVSLSGQADELSVEIRDNGAGMSEEVLTRSVEPFFTTKAPGHGMGLGLHLVRVVSDAMGGRLDLSSSPNKGTVARLVLPQTSLAMSQGSIG